MVGNPAILMVGGQQQLWQAGQSIQDQIRGSVDDDGAALTIVGARGPINSHWVTPTSAPNHTLPPSSL